MTQSQCDDYTASLAGKSDDWLTEEVASRLAKVREAQRKGAAWANVKDDEWARIHCLSQHCRSLGKESVFEAGVDLANKRRDAERRKQQETRP